MVFERARPKKIGAHLVTGPALAGLVEAYVAAINQGAVPTIATAFQVHWLHLLHWGAPLSTMSSCETCEYHELM
jgi:Guanylate-binding protein, C-terminal domain